jgi:outer membrane murein-binding lipoprotein Lpp
MLAHAQEAQARLAKQLAEYAAIEADVEKMRKQVGSGRTKGKGFGRTSSPADDKQTTSLRQALRAAQVPAHAPLTQLLSIVAHSGPRQLPHSCAVRGRQVICVCVCVCALTCCVCVDLLCVCVCVCVDVLWVCVCCCCVSWLRQQEELEGLQQQLEEREGAVSAAESKVKELTTQVETLQEQLQSLEAEKKETLTKDEARAAADAAKAKVCGCACGVGVDGFAPRGH